MRVVQVAPTAFGADGVFGGGERYPLELARALSRHVDSELVTFGQEPRVAREPDGTTVRVLRPFACLHHHPAHPMSLALWSALRKADVVHTHHLQSMPSRVAAIAGTIRGQPLAVTDHGLSGGGWGGLLPGFFDRFLTVSQYSARTLGSARSRTRVVYGGADVERYSPKSGGDRDGILFVGRLTPHKGVDRLIQALPAGARLVVVGTGGHDSDWPERDYGSLLRRLGEGRAVRFVGAVPDAELALLYRRAKVLAFPSVELTCYGRRIAVSELLGLSLLEAMASATPVVASRVGGVPEVVRDGETGFLVDPGDIEELRDRLSLLLGDSALACRLGDNARDLVCERFTWDMCARRCLEAYEELTGPR